jgi:heme exporter protein D
MILAGIASYYCNAVFAMIFFILWLAVLIFLISLAVRFVRAVEKIAKKIDNSSKL